MIFITITQEKKYDNRANLLFTDTGSLDYEIETENVHEDFHETKEFV